MSSRKPIDEEMSDDSSSNEESSEDEDEDESKETEKRESYNEEEMDEVDVSSSNEERSEDEGEEKTRATKKRKYYNVEEKDDLLNFLVEKTKNVTHTMCLQPTAKEYKATSGSTRKVKCLRSRIQSLLSKIPTIDRLDTDTKVKILFAFSISIERDFLMKLRENATVKLDNAKRIIKYKQTGGGLELKGTHKPKKFIDDTETKILDFLSEQCLLLDSPPTIVWLTENFNKSTRSCCTSLSNHISNLRKKIYETDFDIKLRIRMLFITSASLQNYHLHKLRKDAQVEVDKENRITKYEANDGSLSLRGDHRSYAKIRFSKEEKRKSMLAESNEKKDASGNEGNDEDKKRKEESRSGTDRSKESNSGDKSAISTSSIAAKEDNDVSLHSNDNTISEKHNLQLQHREEKGNLELLKTKRQCVFSDDEDDSIEKKKENKKKREELDKEIAEKNEKVQRIENRLKELIEMEREEEEDEEEKEDTVDFERTENDDESQPAEKNEMSLQKSPAAHEKKQEGVDHCSSSQTNIETSPAADINSLENKENDEDKRRKERQAKRGKKRYVFSDDEEDGAGEKKEIKKKREKLDRESECIQRTDEKRPEAEKSKESNSGDQSAISTSSVADKEDEDVPLHSGDTTETEKGNIQSQHHEKDGKVQIPEKNEEVQRNEERLGEVIEMERGEQEDEEDQEDTVEIETTENNERNETSLAKSSVERQPISFKIEPDSTFVESANKRMKLEPFDGELREEIVQILDEGDDYIEEIPIQEEIIPKQEPEEFVEKEEQNLQSKIIEAFHTFVISLDIRQLQDIQEKIEMKMITTGNGEIPINTLLMGFSSCLLIINRNGSTQLKMEESFSLKEFLQLFRLIIITLKIPCLDGFLNEMTQDIRDVSIVDKRVSIDIIKTALEASLAILVC